MKLYADILLNLTIICQVFFKIFLDKVKSLFIIIYKKTKNINTKSDKYLYNVLFFCKKKNRFYRSNAKNPKKHKEIFLRVLGRNIFEQTGCRYYL